MPVALPSFLDKAQFATLEAALVEKAVCIPTVGVGKFHAADAIAYRQFMRHFRLSDLTTPVAADALVANLGVVR